MVSPLTDSYNPFMGNGFDFFAATKVIDKVNSPVNGEISVIKSLGFGTYIQVEGLTQSGGVVFDVWRTTLKKVRRTLSTNHHTLILGLGGGSAAKLVRRYWPEAEITGIDLDPLIVELGKKYLKLDGNVKIIIGDTFEILTAKNPQLTAYYDLILIDMYVGTTVPKNFETERFIQLVSKRLTKEGVAVFNRLYYGEKRPLAVKFMQKLERYFSEVIPVYPEANVMFICKR